jgi:hypothetical protein
MRIRVIELIGVSMRIIRDVCPMTPVCIAKIDIIIETAKIHSAFMRRFRPFYIIKAVYSHENPINMQQYSLE